MSLILSAITAKTAVVASDGAEFQLREDETRYMAFDRRQKLFSIPGRSIVLAAHGENRLALLSGGLDSRRMLGDIFNDLIREFETDETVEQVTLHLRDLLNADVAHTFKLLEAEWPKYTTALGICVIGFDDANAEIKGFEVFWPWIGTKEDPMVQPLFQREALSYAGDGKNHVEFVIKHFPHKFGLHRLKSASDRSMQAYIRGIYRAAEERQGTARDFGGQYSEITVTRDGCSLTAPTANPIGKT